MENMDGIGQKRKYPTDNIAMVMLLVASLAVAYLITYSRYAGPRKAGAQIVTQIKRKGISSFLDEHSRQSFFVIKDQKATPVGFTMDVFSDTPADNRFPISSAGLVYMRPTHQRPSWEQLALFRCDDSFNEFLWKSETVRSGERTAADIILGPDGMLTITQLGPKRQRQEYRPDPALMPDFLIEMLFTEILGSRHKKIIVETITAEGKARELAVSKTRRTDSDPPPAEAEYVLNVAFRDKPGFFQKVYFDNQGRISLISLMQDGLYFLERTSFEAVLRQFPERANLILRRKELLDSSYRSNR